MILLTGGNGFLGKHLQIELRDHAFIAPTSSELDLTHCTALGRFCVDHGVSSIIHLAALCGGIGLNRSRPGDLIDLNLRMGINVLNVARDLEMQKVVLLGTVCSYPKHAIIPFREHDIWNGYPEETNAPYGIAKKTLMVMGNAYREQFGLNVITVVPVNLAGEHDHFEEQSSHVIPALIKKFVDAAKNGDESVTLWGDGSASREFLNAKDCARGIRLAFEHYDNPEPVNLGTGLEVTIKRLAHMIADRVGYRGEILWDATKPNGQPRRCLDVTRARKAFGFQYEIPLHQTLDDVIQYYKMTLQPGG